LLSYQGRILVSGSAFSGTGQFKFALVGADGTQIYWLNSADANNDGQPDTGVSVPVNGGLFTLFLGDTNLAGMSALPTSIFTNPSVHLRIWFNDGMHGVQQLAPDQIVAPAAYALMAANVANGVITAANLATNTATAINAALSARVDALTAQLSGSIMTGSTISSLNPQDPLLLSEGFRLFTTVPAPGWTTSSAVDTPSAATGQAGVWTGQQLLVWGGSLGGGVDSGMGAAYRPDLDLWQTISGTNAPAARDQHSAVWSGQEMIVWGGASGGNYVNTGGRFNPSNAVWTAVSTNGAPAGRIGHVAVWTGGRMVVWGGRNNNGVLGDGAYYDPVADQWTTLTLSSPPSPRFGAVAVSTGNRVLVWGGQDPSGALNTGAQLILGTTGVPTAWVAISSLNAPTNRSAHSMVWTGQKLLVWGGQGGGSFLGDGALYDPVADAWSPITATNGPAARSAHSAVWSGQEMLVFGGEAFLGTLSDGGAYDPAAGTWRSLSALGSPQARSGATTAWSGSAMLVFGGQANGAPVLSLQMLNPQPTWYFYRKP
jgi:N-acetylneuraminic acid mutarotase